MKSRNSHRKSCTKLGIKTSTKTNATGLKAKINKSRVAVVSVLLLIGGYLVADMWDLAPGIFTLKEPANLARPYPQIKGTNTLQQKKAAQLPNLQNDAPLPDKTRIVTALQELANSPEMTGKVTALVADVRTGETLAELDPLRLATPASVNKLLTATAVLSAYDPNQKFATETKIAGQRIYLVAGGDVLLSADHGNVSKTVGRAGLGDLAQKTAQALATQNITATELALDASLFAPQAFGENATADTPNWIMESSPIAINRALNAKQQITAQPKQQVLSVFAEKLAAAGVEVKISGESTTPAAAQLLAKAESAPLRELVDLMLLESDNTLAQTLGHLVAVKLGEKADYAGAAAAVLRQLENDGFTLHGASQADASGLSEENRLPAVLVNQILQKIAKCDEPSCASLLSALPVAKLDGTLARRFTGLDVGGYVRAKTGSLNSVTSMAGLLYTKAGRELSFVIIVDQVPDNGAYELRPLLDATIAKIVAAQ